MPNRTRIQTKINKISNSFNTYNCNKPTGLKKSLTLGLNLVSVNTLIASGASRALCTANGTEKRLVTLKDLLLLR